MNLKIETTSYSDVPKKLQKHYDRVCNDYVNVDVLIVSKNMLQESEKKDNLQAMRVNKNELEAKWFYEELGYTVLRLSHFQTSGINNSVLLGQVKATREHRRDLETLMPKHMFNVFAEPRPLTFDCLFSSVKMQCATPSGPGEYPPDFLVINETTGDFKFVEVKGPTDKLHYTQANWIERCALKNWPFEIFASVKVNLDSIYRITPESYDTTEKFLSEENEYYDKLPHSILYCDLKYKKLYFDNALENRVSAGYQFKDYEHKLKAYLLPFTKEEAIQITQGFDSLEN